MPSSSPLANGLLLANAMQMSPNCISNNARFCVIRLTSKKVASRPPYGGQSLAVALAELAALAKGLEITDLIAGPLLVAATARASAE